MAAAKKKASKKAAKKASSKAQGRAKQPKVSTVKPKAARKPQDGPKRPKLPKAEPKAATPQDATGKPTSGSLNPYRVGGAYWASVEALTALGVGKMHPFAEIVPAVKRAMAQNWKAFAEKEARSDETGKDAERRILQNVSVLARKDYGKPLREVGYEVRWDGRQKVAGLVKVGSE